MFLLAALVLAACGTTPVPGFSLEYQRSGGIAGVDDRLVVDADWNATLTRSGQATEFTLDAETIAGLQALLDKAGFADLDAEYLPAQQGADLFEYTLTYLGHTVRTADTAVPAGLQPVLDELSRIIDAGGQP
jgi:hypothetical protein